MYLSTEIVVRSRVTEYKVSRSTGVTTIVESCGVTGVPELATWSNNGHEDCTIGTWLGNSVWRGYELL